MTPKTYGASSGTGRIAQAVASAALLALAAPTAAHATFMATIRFDSPTATVSPTDIIPVYIHVDVSPLSTPLVVGRDPSVGNVVTSGISPEEIAAVQGDDGNMLDPAQVVFTWLLPSTVCTDSFGLCYGGPDYRWQWAAGPGTLDYQGFTWNPGFSGDFLIGTFTPIGAAPVGTYNLYDIRLTAIPTYANLNGGWLDLAITCPDQSPSCAFSRTVALPDAGGGGGVPEPATWTMMLAGFGLAGSAMRRQRARAAAI
jgi:hypothetical protein